MFRRVTAFDYGWIGIHIFMCKHLHVCVCETLEYLFYCSRFWVISRKALLLLPDKSRIDNMGNILSVA